MTPSADRPLRIAAYLRPRGLINPTGVGKHQLNMILELSQRPDCRVTLLVPRGDLVGGRLPVRTPLDALPVVTLPGTARLLEFLWTFVGFPRADAYPLDVDWIYSPVEAWIATRHVPLAATIHCTEWFERTLTWHRDQATQRVRRRLAPTFRRIARDAGCVFTVSSFLKERFLALFDGDPSRVHVVGNGAEEAFQSGPTPDASPFPFRYLVVVGPLLPVKGMNHLLAFSDVLARHQPDMRIVVVGGLCSSPDHVTSAKQHANVVLTGYLGLDRLPAIVRHATACLALSEYESFGIPVAEAMAAGVPVVAARRAALPEVVANAGLLVSPDDPLGVLHAVMAIMDNSDLRHRLIAAGQRRAKDFTWRNCAQQAYDALQRTCTR